jgi:hypothetical protein
MTIGRPPVASQVEISIFKTSFDGLYWGRYPNGDKPSGDGGAAAVGVNASASLTTKVKLSGGGSVASAVAATLSGGGGGATRVWNPGIYMDSNTVIFKGQTAASRIASELSTAISTNGCVGHCAFITWSCLEPSQDTYNTAILDEIYNTLSPSGKRMMIIIEVGAFTSTHPGTNDDSILPLYLQQSVSTYGQAGWRITSASMTAAPAAGATSATLSSSWQANSGSYTFKFGDGETKTVTATKGSTAISWSGGLTAAQTSTTVTFSVITQPAGVSGWSGGDGNGNTYAAQLHRTSVMARLIKCVQQVATWANSKPLFEGIVYGENSFWIGANSANGSTGSGYTDSASTVTQTSLMQATVAALTTANCFYENTFMQTSTPCQDLETTIVQSQATPGQTDLYGHMYITYRNSPSGTLFGWGQQAYVAQRATGSTATLTNWKAAGVRFLTEIQAPDLGAFGGIAGGSFTFTLASAPAAGATSAQISPSFNNGKWPNGVGYSIRFSNGTIRSCTVTDGKTLTWSGGLGSAATVTATCSMGGSNGFTPQDLADSYNLDYGASHVLLTFIPDSATYVPADRRWTQAFAVLKANPPNGAYPTNYS